MLSGRVEGVIPIKIPKFISFFLLLGLFWSSFNFPAVRADASHPAEDPVLYLADKDLSSVTVNLDGDWEFYWKQLLAPSDFAAKDKEKTGFFPVPSAWNGYRVEGQNLPGQGYATYRLLLEVADNSQNLGLKLPRIFTSYRLWINGEDMASGGRVGQDRSRAIPQYLPRSVFFRSDEPQVELIIQVSNFSHRSAGILESIELGEQGIILAQENRRIAYELFMFGALLIMGVYHLALFNFRKKEPSFLYFGIFCLLLGLRTIMVGEIFFIRLFPGFNWEIAHKMQTLSFYLSIFVMTMFFRSSFPRFFSAKYTRLILMVVASFSLLVLFTPARIFTQVNPAFQIFTLVVAAFSIRALYRATQQRERGGYLIIAGALVLIITAVNDILFLSILMSDFQLFSPLIRTGNLSSLGLLGFVFSHSLVLSLRYSQAFRQNELLTVELQDINKNLEARIKNRTEELEISNQKISQQKDDLEKANQALEIVSFKDPLTDIWNRRYFDEAVQVEWRRALQEGSPISLIFVDIDDFKAYNDFYGHHDGDNCLIRVGEVLKKYSRRAGEMVARYGGEEFVILLPRTNLVNARELAETLRGQVEGLKIMHGAWPGENPVTISLGVATLIPDEHNSARDLVAFADQAMYEAKSKGKNRVIGCSP